MPKIYIAQYCADKYSESPQAFSVHTSRKQAEVSIKIHKFRLWKTWLRKHTKFGTIANSYYVVRIMNLKQ